MLEWGTCWDIDAGYYVQKQGPEHHRVLQKHCGFDEYSCASSFMREHAVGASKWCWLDSRDDSVDWEPPTDPNEYNAGYDAGIVFLSLCGVWLLIPVCLLGRQKCLACMDASNSRDLNARLITSEQEQATDQSAAVTNNAQTDASVPNPEAKYVTVDDVQVVQQQGDEIANSAGPNEIGAAESPPGVVPSAPSFFDLNPS